MLRIAHVSDMHVLSTAGVEWSKMLFNKRISGCANLVLRRGIVGATSVPCRKLVGRPNASSYACQLQRVLGNNCIIPRSVD